MIKDRFEERKKLIEYLISLSYLKRQEIIEAFLKVPRELHIPDKYEKEAYDDRPLPIGYEQTISAPDIVAMMTECLEIEPSDKILEVGTGSGYQASILAEIAKEGHIYTIERLEPLAKRAEQILNKYNNVTVIIGDGTKGYSEASPFDKIVVTARATKVPPALITQMKENSRLVIPLGNAFYQMLTVIIKIQGKIKKKSLGSCMFVPLISENTRNDY